MMRELNKKSGFFWISFSVSVIFLSYDLGLGTFTVPGSGFLPALAGGTLLLLSLILLGSAFIEGKRNKVIEVRIGTLRVVWILLALVFYGLFLEKIGFLLAAFVLMGSLLLGFGRQKILLVVIFAVLSSLGTFAVFSLWLKTPLPKGVFGF